jgi:hypothetical protein
VDYFQKAVLKSNPQSRQGLDVSGMIDNFLDSQPSNGAFEIKKILKMLANLLLLAATILADAEPVKRDFLTMQNPQVLHSSSDYVFRIEMRA